MLRWRRLRPIDACIALGAVHFALFAIVAIARLRYPFDVEWMEGGELTHAVRLLEGKPLYARPSAEFAAFLYPPFYPAVVAAMAPLFGGVSYALGRGISLASTLSTMGLLYWIVRREAGVRFALLALGMYAALDRFAGTFFHVARPDALALVLGFGATALARYGRGGRSTVASALLCVLAVFTKQTMLVLAVAIGAWLLLYQRRRGIAFSLVGIVVGAAAALALQIATNGWFAFYVVSGHQSHVFHWENAFFYFWRDLLFLAPLLLIVPLAWVRDAYRSWLVAAIIGIQLAAVFVQRAITLDYPPHMYFRELAYESPRVLLLVPPLLIAALLLVRRPARTMDPTPGENFWLWMFGAALAASAIGHSTQWAYKNAFLPGALYGALFLALAARRLGSLGRATEVTWAIAFAIQLVALADAPSSRMPTASDRARVVALRERLAPIAGRVLVLAHPLLAYEHDGQTHVHQMGLSDFATVGGIPDFDAKLSSHFWDAVVTDDGDGLDVPDAVRAFYDPVENLDGPWMKTGVRVHPATLWRPRSAH